MNDTTQALAVIVISAFIGALIGHYAPRSKQSLHHATVAAKPGVILDLVDDEGGLVATVILSQITRSRDTGTDVLFTDYFRWISRNRL